MFQEHDRPVNGFITASAENVVEIEKEDGSMHKMYVCVWVPFIESLIVFFSVHSCTNSTYSTYVLVQLSSSSNVCANRIPPSIPPSLFLIQGRGRNFLLIEKTKGPPQSRIGVSHDPDSRFHFHIQFSSPNFPIYKETPCKDN